MASAELVDEFLTPVVRSLERTPGLAMISDPTLFLDAATDALLDLIQRPDSYDSERSALGTYLRMAARRNAQNELAKRQRRDLRITPLDELVELPSLSGNMVVNAIEADGTEEMWARVDAVINDPTDRVIVRMMIEGERSRAAYAAVMDIGHLPVHEQNEIVDRAKDRIRTRLRRAGRTRLLPEDINND